MGRFPDELSGGDKNVCDTEVQPPLCRGGKLSEPLRRATVFIRSHQWTVKQTNCYQFCLQSLLVIEPLLAENHFAIILSPKSVACSPPCFTNEKGLSHSKCDDDRICLFSKREDFYLPGDSSFQTKSLTCIQLQGGYIYITINVMKITVHQSLVSLAENSQ